MQGASLFKQLFSGRQLDDHAVVVHVNRPASKQSVDSRRVEIRRGPIDVEEVNDVEYINCETNPSRLPSVGSAASCQYRLGLITNWAVG